MTAERVLQIIGERVKSDRSLLYDRYMFHSCNQQEDESFDTYFIRLKRILDVCKYNQNVTTEEMIRDRLVFGIRDINLKRKFLKEDPTVLTLDKLKQICKIKEATDQQLKILVPEEKGVNKISDTKKENKIYKFCAKSHPFKKELCPAWGKTCSGCGGKNHILRACKKNSKKIPYQKNTREKSGKNKKIREISKEDDSDEEESEEEEAQILKVLRINKLEKEKKGRAKLKLKFGKEWRKVYCDLDTCSEANVIGFKSYCKLAKTTNPLIKPTEDQLKGFGGLIATMGKTEIPT